MSSSPKKSYSSIWHYFNVEEMSTYPQQESIVQIQLADGRIEEGSSRDLFSPSRLKKQRSIVGWRFVRQKASQ